MVDDRRLQHGDEPQPAGYRRSGGFGPTGVQLARGTCERCPALPAAAAYARRYARRRAWVACLDRPAGRWAASDPAHGIPIAGAAPRRRDFTGGGTGGTAVRDGAFPMGDGAAGMNAIGTGPCAGHGRRHHDQSDNQAPHAPSIDRIARILYARRPALSLTQFTQSENCSTRSSTTAVASKSPRKFTFGSPRCGARRAGS